MFNEKENSGYWALGKDTAQHITQWLEAAHLHRTNLIRSQQAATQEKQDQVDDEDLQNRKDRSDAAQQRVTKELDKDETRDKL
jgi:beta-lactamase class A